MAADPIPSAEINARRIDILLAEYKAAQDSAEHHDTLLWTVAAIILAGMTGVVAFKLTKSIRFWPSLLLPIFGVTFAILLRIFVSSFAAFRRFKYERCQAIEKDLSFMSQHSGLKEYLAKEKVLSQRDVIRKISCVYMACWIVWTIWAICRHFHLWGWLTSHP